MRNVFLSSAVLAVLTLGAASSFGATIANLSTGLDGSGNLQTTGGSVDANWTYVDPFSTPTSGSAEVVAPNNADWYGGWVGNGPNSSWIAPNPNTSNNGAAPYTFSTAFDLSGYDLSTVALSGAWAIDDQGTVSLNGIVISTLGSGAWGSLTAFSVAAGSPDLNQGVNTLTITMTGDDQFLEAARLEGSVTGDLSTAPEPATLGLLGTSLIALIVARRRRA